MGEQNKVFIEGEAILYQVRIEGRGGDSAHDEHFETRDAAILASAVDGKNRIPTPVEVDKLSDGSYVTMKYISVYSAPTEEQTAKLLENLTPAQKILLNRK